MSIFGTRWRQLRRDQLERRVSAYDSAAFDRKELQDEADAVRRLARGRCPWCSARVDRTTGECPNCGKYEP